MNDFCKECGKQIVFYNGKVDADILIVGDAPHGDDYKNRVPLSGRDGAILMYELGRVGIQLQKCRIATVWRHYPSKSQACLQSGLDDLMVELIRQRKGIIFIGSGFEDLFRVPTLKDCCGIVLNALPSIGLEGNFVFIPGLHTVSNGFVGEFRLGLEKFKEKIKNV